MARSATRAAVMALSVALAVSACSSGAEFQYLESDDGHAFSKIPVEWSVVSEGAVAYTLLDADTPSLGFVAGDDTQPWRAIFTARSDGRIDIDRPSGMIEIQHIDARYRNTFEVEDFLTTIPRFDGDDGDITSADVEEIDRRSVRVGDLSGYRVLLAVDELGRGYDQIVLTDAERRAMYLVSVSCTSECLERFAEDIDEILTTFRVE